jgi:hypothetical protein
VAILMLMKQGCFTTCFPERPSTSKMINVLEAKKLRISALL